jgi:hypothetical protein
MSTEFCQQLISRNALASGHERRTSSGPWASAQRLIPSRAGREEEEEEEEEEEYSFSGDLRVLKFPAADFRFGTGGGRSKLVRV